MGKWAADNDVWENLILGKLGKTVMGNRILPQRKGMQGYFLHFPAPGPCPPLSTSVSVSSGESSGPRGSGAAQASSWTVSMEGQMAQAQREGVFRASA